MVNIVIIDYGMGNLRSVEKAFQRLGINPKISYLSDDILNADKLVLPGVGHFKKGMDNLYQLGIIDSLKESVIVKKKPVIGICLGMQLMTKYSEEGNCEGLGWIKAETIKFSFDDIKLKIPHMGWNNLFVKNNTSLLKNINEEDFFYFIHSYYVSCNNEKDILSETKYGNDFISCFQRDNIFGSQFHPEKSHDAGLKLHKNFANL